MPFSPDDIPGLALWLDASHAASLFQLSGGTTPAVSDGDPVGYWGDRSGNGRHFIQATSGRRATLKAAEQNGLNVARFDGVDDWLGTGSAWSLASLTAGTVFYVMKTIDSENNGCPSYLGVDSNFHYPFADGKIYDNNGTIVRKANITPASSLFVWNVYVSTSAAGLWKCHQNGAQLYSTETNTVGWAASESLAIGGSGGGNLPYGGDIASVIIYDSALSDANRQLVEAYLKEKWATP